MRTLKNGYEIWLELEASGLEVARKKQLDGYDKELANTLRLEIFPNKYRNIRQLLRSSPTSPVAFLELSLKH